MENLYSGYCQLFSRNFGVCDYWHFGYACKRYWSVGSSGRAVDYGLLACLCHWYPDSYCTHGKNGSKKAYAIGFGIIFCRELDHCHNYRLRHAARSKNYFGDQHGGIYGRRHDGCRQNVSSWKTGQRYRHGSSGL